jgi:hypothetical protein
MIGRSDEGACGQSIRDENDPIEPLAQDGGGYCEHYPEIGDAHCQPQRCDCQLPGWPDGMGCGADQKCTF